MCIRNEFLLESQFAADLVEMRARELEQTGLVKSLRGDIHVLFGEVKLLITRHIPKVCLRVLSCTPVLFRRTALLCCGRGCVFFSRFGVVLIHFYSPYVIFITENDVIGSNQPIYTIERQITNIGQAFGDGEHIIYVNGADKNGATELGKLMHDFFCTDPGEMYFKQLADKVRYFKEDEKGVAAMCKVMEDMRMSVADEVRVENAKKMLADGVAIEKVAEYSGLSLEKVQEIAGQKSA